MTMQQEVPQASSGLAQEGNVEPKPNPIGLDPDMEVKMVAWAKSQFSTMKQDRAKVEKQWYLNICFYRGRQNVVMRNGQSVTTGVAGSIYTPPAPYYRARPVINRIRPIIRSEMAKLTAQKPTAYILPATSEDKDLFAAQAGEQIWESKYRGKRIPAVFRRALWWNQICGNGFVRSIWDPDEIDTDSDQMGDMKYECVTPFHLFVPDLTEEELEEQPFIIYAQLHTMDWVKMNYPDAKVQKQSDDQQNEIIDNNWMDIAGASSKENSKGVLCLEVWVKPRKLSIMPDGGMFIVVGDSVVSFVEGWPYQHGKYPFAKLSHIPTGKFYTDSTIVDLISPQREYNRTRGQIIESKNKMSKPQLIAERGSVDPSKITSEPGQVIEYAMGYQKPEPLPLQGLPAYVTQELDRILTDMADISGQHEVSKGQVPPGVTAATAINYLQEMDDSILSYTFAALEEAFEKIAFMTLSYAQQYWDTPRMVKVTGNDEYFDSLMFLGSDLKGNTDIRVEAGSALPLSKSAKQAFIMDLMKMGFIDPMTGLEVMEMGGIAKVYESVKTDVRQAQRENLRLAQIDDATFQQLAMQGTGQESQIVPVNTWDNHMIHIETHNKFRKSQQFEMLSDSAKQAFEMHVQMHQYATAQGMTGESLTELVKPENEANMNAMVNVPPEESRGGGNQFTEADNAQASEAPPTEAPGIA